MTSQLLLEARERFRLGPDQPLDGGTVRKEAGSPRASPGVPGRRSPCRLHRLRADPEIPGVSEQSPNR
jgi:hypothetical protein